MNYSSDEDDKPLVFKRTSTANRLKHSSKLKSASVVKREKPFTSTKPPAKQESDIEDSEDDKPLSSRISTVPKANLNHVKTQPVTSTSQRPKPQVKNEDSDDEKPLSSKFTSVGPSINKKVASDDDKPLSSRVKQNGSTSRDNINQINKKPNIGLNKTPPNEERLSGQSSVKKPKISDSKDENDHVPISQRMKNQAPSGSKSSSSVKQKVIKVNSSSFKKTFKKSKKVENKSKYSKSSKVPPGSGEGQKWKTLVHNGVIFPPPYKPHGIKILYKGKPVDLTPAQEEARNFITTKPTIC